MKNARRRLEITMPATMLCKTPANCRGETCRSIGKRKTKYASIVDADEPMRIRLEGVPHRYHEDHISAKGINSLNHYISVPKFFRMLQALQIPDAWSKAAQKWKKNGENSELEPQLEKNTGTAGHWQKSETKKRWSKKQGIRAEKFISRQSWIFVISRIRS